MERNNVNVEEKRKKKERKKKYKRCKAVRRPTCEGIVPINWLLFNHLQASKRSTDIISHRCQYQLIRKRETYHPHYKSVKRVRRPSCEGIVPFNLLLYKYLNA
jgi:hypothetical protein